MPLDVFREFAVKEMPVPDHGPAADYSLEHAIYCYVRYRTSHGDSEWVQRGPLLTRAVDVFEIPPPEVDDAIESLVREGHIYKPGPDRYGVI